MKHIWKRRRTRAMASVGFLCTVLVLPILWVNWRLYRQNLRVDNEDFHVLPPPQAHDRLLIVAPHCDDETLGCGGLIAMARRGGAAVKVVVVTNGDASFSTALSKVRLSPSQCIEMAYARQRETLVAVKELGLSEEDVVFLGYPDGGTAAMWFECWNTQRLFTSRFTRQNRSPYRNSFRPAAPYCGMAELDDIRRIIQEFQPTAIYTTHPNDVHSDHWATYAFVTAALEALKLEGRRFARKARLYTYLIHRGDGWPAPKGYYPHERLVPPAKLVNGDTRWYELPLDAEGQEQKRRALLRYHSQLTTMGKWMKGFVRQTELFGIVPPVEINESTDQWINGSMGQWVNWTAMPVILRDPVRDSFARDMVGQGDIEHIAVEADDQFLYVRVDLDKGVSRRLVYRLALHGFVRDKEKVRIVKYTLRLFPPERVKVVSVNGIGSVEVKRDVRLITSGNHLGIVVPRSWFGSAHTLMIAASSAFHGITVDKTAYKLLRLPKEKD